MGCKKSFLSFSFFVATAVVFSGCGDKKEGSGLQQSSQPIASASVGSDKSLGEGGMGSIDIIGSTAISKDVQKAEVAGDKIVIGGWAVDNGSKKLASKIVVNLCNQDFLATYGGNRADVAQVHSNAEYTNSGYNVLIPLANLPKGECKAILKIYSADNSGYYTLKSQPTVIIK